MAKSNKEYIPYGSTYPCCDGVRSCKESEGHKGYCAFFIPDEDLSPPRLLSVAKQRESRMLALDVTEKTYTSLKKQGIKEVDILAKMKISLLLAQQIENSIRMKLWQRVQADIILPDDPRWNDREYLKDLTWDDLERLKNPV